MTVDEAIEMYANNAEYERTHGSLQGCMDFRQLAEWLKDYKRLKEQEPKTGHWIVHEIESTLKWLECSNCHCETSYKIMYNYCPNCGAKMVEPQETETWNGYHGQITAPKGTFERIFNDADDDNDI